MEKKNLVLIKVGGKVVEEKESLNQLLKDFSNIEGHKILVHGGGRSATQIATKLGIESKMVDGRRVTDENMLKIVTMVYGGLINKQIVAQLQALGVNALGLTGADLNYMQASKRPVKTIDYGFVGDIDRVNTDILSELIEKNVVPILAPLTHDCKGNLLNTNADTIAGETAIALAKRFNVTLMYCFEKSGVLIDENNDQSVIEHINPTLFRQYVEEGIINGGMIPKIENAITALQSGVNQVIITKANQIHTSKGTKISLT